MSYSVIHVTDSFDLIRESGGHDVVITDPPYPQRVQGNLCSGSLVGTKNVPKYELPFAPIDQKRTWILDAVARTPRWVVSFCSVEDFGRLQDIAPASYVRSAIWAKSNAMGQLTADRPATSYEGIAILHGATLKKRWNGRGSYGLWSCPGTRGKKERHPNEKPLHLCLKLVALFSERGEVVFDPFCGSAAIGEACIMLGRHYVGWDNSEVWVTRASARLAAINSSMSDEEALKLCYMWGNK